jgi:hypothetical protein
MEDIELHGEMQELGSRRQVGEVGRPGFAGPRQRRETENEHSSPIHKERSFSVSLR